MYHSEDREILRDLYEKETWVDIYYFHGKYLLSPAQLSRSINKFEKMKIVELSESTIRLTEFGFSWLLANRRSVFFENLEIHWKDPITGYEKREKGQRYFPAPSKMRKSFFTKLAR